MRKRWPAWTRRLQRPRHCSQPVAGAAQGSRYASLPAANKAMLDGLLPPLIEVAAGFPNAGETLTRILDCSKTIARRGPYLALLKEYPQTLRRSRDCSAAARGRRNT
jgi:[glutamine synthetase] adenylyltransferase / [glutamine synthetase]-adenylyl-L-tyrosine phosphorylase